MPADRHITFVVPVQCWSEELEENLLASPCLRQPHPHQVLVQERFASAAKAYNQAIELALNDLIVFVHQDVILPLMWISDLERMLLRLEETDPRWGVLGCYGVTRSNQSKGYIYSPGPGVIGRPFERPVAVQTLDEVVLIVRRSSGLRFDDTLPHFHLYGTDICLRAKVQGMQSYAISAFCIHNAQEYLILPREFYNCCRHVKRVWRRELPIQTPCTRITRFNVPLYERRLREAHLRYVRHRGLVAPRAKDVPKLIKDVETALQLAELSWPQESHVARL
jgi:hypothetical protein